MAYVKQNFRNGNTLYASELTHIEEGISTLEKDLDKVLDGIPGSVEQATPTISVSSGGLITASSTQQAGVVAAGTKTATRQLTAQAAQTITPGTTDKTISSGRYLTGTQTIKGDANLVANNIRSGVSIFGVNGTLSPGSGINAQSKTVTPTKSTQTVTPDSGYNALSSVVVNPIPNNYIVPSGTMNINDNGTHNVTNYASVNVNVPSSGGGVELPALANPGAADDLVYGKQLIGADGNVVTGSLAFFVDTLLRTTSMYKSNDNLKISNTAYSKGYVNTNSELIVDIPLAEFGNATAADVAAGKTFTSSAGLKVQGEANLSGGVELPTLTNPGSASDLAQGKQLIGADGSVVEGNVQEYSGSYRTFGSGTIEWDDDWAISNSVDKDVLLRKDTVVTNFLPRGAFGNATAADVAAGKTFTSENGLKIEGTALLPGGGFVYPDGAFAPVASFTDGKQYALVAVIDGVRRYINTTTYNNYTMNATQIAINEDAGDYVIFSTTPALFTAVASGNGFLLQNGANYLHGTSSGGTALRVGTTQAVWTVDASATGGFSEGKYYAKEDTNAVWLMNNTGGYNWSIKYETAGSFGYDREGRDNTYSTGFVSFVLYEYVAGEGEVNPVVDTSDATATANDMARGKTAYVNGRKVTGNVSRYANDDFYALAGVGLSSDSNGKIGVVRITDKAEMFDEGTEYAVTVAGSEFGNATAADVAAGKTFTSSAGLKVTGTATSGNTGDTIKTGTTTSGTIATGLSSIEEFFIYKESQTATGLIHLHYSKTNGTSYLYASAWSTQTYGTKTIANGTTAATVSGGSITLPRNTATSGGLTSGVTYKWIAIGTE